MKVKYKLDDELVGGQVVEVGTDANSFPYLVVVKNKKKYAIFISRDEEANGPGQPIIQIQDE